MVREAYIMYAQLEMDFAKSVRAEFEDLRDQSYMVRDLESHSNMLTHLCYMCYASYSVFLVGGGDVPVYVL